MDAPVSLPSADEIRRLAAEITSRSIYDLSDAANRSETWLSRIAHVIVRFLRTISEWWDALYARSPFIAWLVLIGLFLTLIALIAHIIYSIRAAVHAPELKIEPDDEARTFSAVEFEKKARELAASGDYINAVRYLFLASLTTLEEAEKKTVRRGATNREYLRRFKNSPAAGSLKLLVEIIDNKWYSGGGCSAEDYQASLNAYAQVRVNTKR